MRSTRGLIIGATSLLLLAMSATDAHATPPDWWDPAWVSRIDVQITEPGITDRNAEYVDLVVDFPPGSYTDLNAEVRVVDDMGMELPSLVHSQAGDQAHVLLNTSVAMAG